MLTKALLRLTCLLPAIVSIHGQGCTSQCPPINFGNEVPSLCEGDNAADFADTAKEYQICHPSPGGTFSFDQFKGPGRVTVISNFYIGCNAGRRESGVFAHVAQKYYDIYGDRTNFVSSLKGGPTCSQWANIYQNDAVSLFPSSGVVPTDVPLSVLDQEYEMRDDFFTTPFGHPSYVILDGDLNVRHKFIGPCCGFVRFSDCTPDTARSLDTTISEYLDALLAEPIVEEASPTPAPVEEDVPVEPTGCTVGEFSDWSDCSLFCGLDDGVQFRWRTVFGPECTTESPVETRSCTPTFAFCGDEGTGCVPEFGSSQSIVTVASGFDSPRDVAFHPTPGLHLGSYSEGRSFDPDAGEEAWVVNGFNHSVSIVSSLGVAGKQTTFSRRDRGYYHYMINVTALAFNTVGDSGRSADRDSFNYWAVCNDNANTYMDTKEPNNFMGPTLYNSDPGNRNVVNRLGEQCEDEEECFFLHADMLHESPACIGIAHDPETTTSYGNVYWVFDSTGNQMDGQLVRFDFQQPHGPGSMDHAVAAVRRYPQITLERGAPGVHAGMVVHPETRELFIAVPGANKIIAVDADSGTYARTAREEYPIFSSRLPSFEYSIFECADSRDFLTEIDTPTGLALSQDGERLFAAERSTGLIFVIDIATGTVLTKLSTGYSSIGGMAISPNTNTLHFVDEDTNALYAVAATATCETPYGLRSSASFQQELATAVAAVDGFSLYKDYECVADPVIPDASFFDQVHDDSGYASENPDVQAMAGMDETAILLANRTDCGYDDELNFDALLLGGFFCHQCLPGRQGAECDAGGVCTNVQWLGYTCDNEFFVVEDTDGSIVLQYPNSTLVDPADITLMQGVTYRFTVKGDLTVCTVDTETAVSRSFTLGDSDGCVTRGPLLIPITSDVPLTFSLQAGDTSIPLNVEPAQPGPLLCFSGETVVSVEKKGQVKMSDLKVGDRVLVDGGRYESVYAFGHMDVSAEAEFLQFMPSMLELSKDHLVFVQNKGAVPASLVKVGDELVGGSTVEGIHSVTRVGVFAPFTPSGTIIVNGVLGSNYVALQEESDVLMIGEIRTPLSFHFLSHMFLSPQRIRRIIFGMDGGILTENGLTWWTQSALEFAQWFLGLEPVFLAILIAPLVVLLALFYSFEVLIANSPSVMLSVVLCSLLYKKTTTHQKVE